MPKENVVGGVRLRAHQQEAVAAVVRALTPGPGVVGGEGLRATVQMATGTGKSFVGAAAAQKLAPRGAVLVVVPTLDLLVQTVGSWQEAGRGGQAYAVCSLTSGELPQGVLGSTSPLAIGMWLARAGASQRPVTLYATYASAGAVADAYAFWAGRGRGLAPLELMVCDEAHRSSGSAEKAWTLVHDQEQVPAVRRLYMTATPRIWAPPGAGARPREEAFQPLPEELAVSMDDEGLFGPQVVSLGLAEAVDRGLLAPFEIVVLELRDPVTDRRAARRQPVPWGPGVGPARDGSEDLVPAERIAAVQAALVKTAVERGLRRVITFHNRTIEARYFSETLNQAVDRLNAENPAEYPQEFWAQWLSGEHEVDFRKSVIRGFGNAEQDEGLRHAVLSNCRVLGEGVDIPNADAVLLQGRGSMVDIVQAIGRALRMKPGEGKTASLIVPVFLGAGEEPGDILASDSYAPLVKVLTALRSHDARLVEALAVPQKSGLRTKGLGAEAFSAPGQGEFGGDSRAAAFTLPVRFQNPVDADVLALFVQLRVLTGETQAWREGIGHARRWYEETGGLDVPYSALVGEEGNFPLGKWLSDRRVEYADGQLAAHRVGLLEQLGMVWSVHEARFEIGLDWARVWAQQHGGSLAAPARASVGGYPVGAWLAAQRAAAQVPAGEPGRLDPIRRALLEAVDPWWCPEWPVTWQRCYAVARVWWLAAEGRVEWARLPVGTVFEGEQLGRWVREQRAAWAELVEEQQELLTALGIEEDPGLAAERAAAARPKTSRADRFRQHLVALVEFTEREGHAKVPRAFRTADGVALGTWLNNTKARRDKLSAEQRGQLQELGVEWA
ncbi:Helicase associated domain protein [Kitasatospora sp. NPDC006697]|uniref:DEAD/DEAH box helicase n=1 Tax=Kitasatospora sp. NPDC006697 TaxID=3364020 RepID=UPI0036A070AE